MNNLTKGTNVIDEMFPDATGCMMELDEVSWVVSLMIRLDRS